MGAFKEALANSPYNPKMKEKVEKAFFEELEQPLVFCSLEEAHKVYRALKTILDDYGFIGVGDLKDIYGGKTYCYLDSLYGWKSLDGFDICESTPNVLMSMPKPERRMINMPLTCKIPSSYLNIKEEDLVNHPQHYKSETGLEAIDVIEAFTFNLEGIEAVDTANVIKYICRWKKKNGVQDLKKAKWYLEHLINHVETLAKENNDDI